MDPRAGARASGRSSEGAERSSHPYLLQDVSSCLAMPTVDSSDCLYVATSSMAASPQTNRVNFCWIALRSVGTPKFAVVLFFDVLLLNQF